MARGDRSMRLHTDGACRGNPGPAGAGALIEDAATGEVLAEIAEYLRTTTNNVAEYRALLLGLERCLDLGAGAVQVVSDSELLVRQVEGVYQVRHPALKPLHARVQALRARFAGGVRFTHTLRSGNRHADELANRAIDKGLGRRPARRDPLPAIEDWPSLGAELPPGGSRTVGPGLALVRASAEQRTAAWVLVLEGSVQLSGGTLQTGQFREGPVRYRAAGTGPALVLELTAPPDA